MLDNQIAIKFKKIREERKIDSKENTTRETTLNFAGSVEFFDNKIKLSDLEISLTVKSSHEAIKKLLETMNIKELNEECFIQLNPNNQERLDKFLDKEEKD